MSEIITGHEGGPLHGEHRDSARHRDSPRHRAGPVPRAPRPRVVALAPAAVIASVVAVSPLVTPPAQAEVRHTEPSFFTTRNGVTCSGPSTRTARTLALRVQTDVGPALRAASARARVAFAADDTASGIRCTAHSTVHFDSASIVKVAIVAALLDLRRSEHRTLSASERAWARAAITRSSNAAASVLWRVVGGAAGMRRFFARAGMTRTVPGPGGYWGLTQVTAGDELILLGHVTRHGLLASADRHYLQGLMTRVVLSQRWGVPVGAPSGASVGSKNGWLPRSTRAWRVHSIGWVELRTTTYDVVLLSDGNASLDAGIGRLDSVARAVHRALGRGRP